MWDRFRCLGVRFVLVFWQTMRRTGWTPFQIAIGFFWANFTYPGRTWTFAVAENFYKKDVGGFQRRTCFDDW